MVEAMCLVEGCMAYYYFMEMDMSTARLAQSAERKALNLVVVGSSPTVGDLLFKRSMQGDHATKKYACCVHWAATKGRLASAT